MRSDKSKGFHSPSPGQSHGWEKHRPEGKRHPVQPRAELSAAAPLPLVTTPASHFHPHRLRYLPRGSLLTPPFSLRSALGKLQGPPGAGSRCSPLLLIYVLLSTERL